MVDVVRAIPTDEETIDAGTRKLNDYGAVRVFHFGALWLARALKDKLNED